MSQMQTKIIAIVVAALVAGFGLLVFKSMEKERTDLLEANYSKTVLLSSSVISSMKTMMMTGNAQSSHDLLADLRKIEGVKEIRLFNKSGEEVSASEDSTSAGIEALTTVKDVLAKGEARKVEGHDTLTLFKPLLAEDRCRGCHNEGEKVLGVVAVSVPLAGVYSEIKEIRFWSLLNAAVAICAVALILALWLKRVVLTPVKQAVDVMDAMEKDKDLTYRMNIKSTDEMGRLGKGFNSFIDSVQKVIQRINRVSYQVGSVSTQIVVNSAKVAEGAQIQAQSSETTSGGIEQISASIKEVAESAYNLSMLAESTSSSILEMTASIDQIAGSAAVLSSSVDSTVSSITEISASIKEVSTSVGVLSEAAERSVDSINRIASSIKEVEVAAKDSAQLSEKVTGEAKNLGMDAMGRAIMGMQKIRGAVDHSGEVINRLGGRSRQIGEILNVIDEVTDQTELLSLNAAILASQAGEHGKGFAVVADEIKDLAERTASSTQEISKLIAAVQSEVSEAVQAMETGKGAVEEGQTVVHEAKEVLEGIVGSSAKSSEMSKRIERATMEQAEGARQVAEAMVNIRDMVKQILRASQDLTSGSDQIMMEAYKVRDVSNQVRTATEEQSKGSVQIIDAVEKVTEQVQHIANATGEQRKGSEEIVRSIERISDVAKENENLASEMGVVVEDLARHIEELKDEVGVFRVSGEGLGIVKFGIVPLESPAQMYKKFAPLAEYLSKKVGREVVFKLTSTFADALRDVGTGVADICYMTPSTYIEAHDGYGVTLLAKAAKKGVPYSHTIIVAKEGSSLNRLDELKGKTFAFGDEMSTSSYLVPKYMLEKAGVKLADLKEYRFLGHHDDVAKAVLMGELDAGGLRETTAYQYREKGLKFLKISEDIPEFNLCARKDLDRDLAERIKTALISLTDRSDESALVLKSIDKDYTGFMEARDSDYDGVRGMMKRI